jgi:hypothetical protein
VESVHVMDANDRQMAPQNGRPHMDTNGRDMRGITLQLTSGNSGIRHAVSPTETEAAPTALRTKRNRSPR